MRMRRPGWIALAIGSFALSASDGQMVAQGVTVRGIVYDSLHSRPLASALVAMGGKTATSDSVGRFIIHEVLPGTYRVTAQHDAIDMLGISAVGALVKVTDGREDVTVAVPSFKALWRLACGEYVPATDTGFVFGTLRSTSAMRNAAVSASWIDVAANGTRIGQKQKTLEVSVDASGNFALCGVPTFTGLSVRAFADGLESGTFDLGPMDRERIVRRDLSLFRPSATSTAVLTGNVAADSGGGPLPTTQIAITDLGRATTTNARGAFRFDSIPPGTHRLYVRRIGYAELEFSVDLHSGDTLNRDIVMTRITILDSMSITGKPLARDAAMRVFEENRRLGLGKFLTAADLDKANGRSLPQMMNLFPFLTIARNGSGQYKASVPARGVKSINGGSCAVKVFVDGVLDRDYDLNAFPPYVIAGVEYYRGPAQIPPEYAGLGSVCAVIAIHTRKK
jgi:hypothetical protein